MKRGAGRCGSLAVSGRFPPPRVRSSRRRTRPPRPAGLRTDPPAVGPNRKFSGQAQAAVAPDCSHLGHADPRWFGVGLALDWRWLVRCTVSMEDSFSAASSSSPSSCNAPKPSSCCLEKNGYGCSAAPPESDELRCDRQGLLQAEHAPAPRSQCRRTAPRTSPPRWRWSRARRSPRHA